MMLLVPGLLRVDVRWYPDALQIHTREFTLQPAVWRSQQDPTQVLLDVDFPDLPAPLTGQAKIVASPRRYTESALVEARIVLRALSGPV